MQYQEALDGTLAGLTLNAVISQDGYIEARTITDEDGTEYKHFFYPHR